MKKIGLFIVLSFVFTPTLWGANKDKVRIHLEREHRELRLPAGNYEIPDYRIPLNSLPPSLATSELTAQESANSFRTFLANLKDVNLKKVNIFIIDSGVRLTEDLSGMIGGGCSISFADDKDPFSDPAINWAIPGHGTFVALDMVRVAPNIKICSVRIFEPMTDEAGEYLGTKISRIIQAFEFIKSWSLQNPEKRAVVNCSFTFEGVPQLAALVAEITHSMPQVSVVAAAGNGNGKSAVGTYPCDTREANVTCVGAHDGTGKLASFSSVGPPVVIAAWGQNKIFTTSDGKIISLNGTSFAAPDVAAIYAVLLGMNLEISPEELRKTILRGGKIIPSLQGKISSSLILNEKGAFFALKTKQPLLAWWRIASALDTTEERDEPKTFSPGEIVIISGTGFCDSTEIAEWPLPTRLCGTEVVTNNGFPLKIVWGSAGGFAVQISGDPFQTWVQNFWGIQKYDSDGNVAGGISLPSFRAGPNPLIYSADGVVPYVETNHGVVNQDNPAQPGDEVLIYVSGLGWTYPVSNTPNQDVRPLEPLTVEVFGIQIEVAVKTTPFVGIQSIFFKLPYLLGKDRVEVRLIVGNASTTAAFPYSGTMP